MHQADGVSGRGEGGGRERVAAVPVMVAAGAAVAGGVTRPWPKASASQG